MLNLYNNHNGIILVGILFLLSMYFLGKSCSCTDINKTTCIRKNKGRSFRRRYDKIIKQGRNF